MKKIKILACLIAGLMTIPMASSCSDTAGSGDGLNIVCTIFPEYDWVREILGDDAKNADLTLLLDNGVDLHSYQPTAGDMVKISSCDVFIYVGGESDGWVDDALEEATNKDMVVINLLDVLGDTVKKELVVEGMQADEHDHDHEDEDDHDHEDEEHKDEEHENEEDHDHEEEEHTHNHADEHVWLSLKNAAILCDYIADKLGEADAAKAETYTSNADAYIEKLNALDKQYAQTVSSAKNATFLFGDRFPFRYLADDYGITYYAAFTGCSAETEASFATIAFLAGKLDELGLNAVLTIEGDNHGIAETIIKNTADKNQTICVMDSMQSTTSADIKSGTTYLSVMQNNLEALKEALN